MAVVTMKGLLEAGVHFGHQKRKWNPNMKKYIYTDRHDIHVIDLEITEKCIEEAYAFVREIAKDKDILFVGTKKQAQDAIKKEATRCGMFYINHRWLGGTLTNFRTIRESINKLTKINQMEATGELDLFTKKEISKMKEERDKLEANLGGIKNMTSLPGALFVVDLEHDRIAVEEARKLNIPIVGLVDTNCDPELVDYVIPGNDDAIRSVQLIASIIANAVIEAREGITFQVEEDDEDFSAQLDNAASIAKEDVVEEVKE